MLFALVQRNMIVIRKFFDALFINTAIAGIGFKAAADRADEGGKGVPVIEEAEAFAGADCGAQVCAFGGFWQRQAGAEFAEDFEGQGGHMKYRAVLLTLYRNCVIVSAD